MAITPNFGLNYPIGTDAIAVPTDLQNLATDMDSNMATMNARAIGTMLLAKDYDPTFVVEVVNTTATSTLVSLPISDAKAGEIYELTTFSRYFNNSGTNRQLTYTLSLGATTLFTGTTGNIATATTERASITSFRIIVDTLNSQLATGVGQVGGTGGGNNPTVANLTVSFRYATATEDLSSSKNLVLTCAHSATGTTTRLRLLGYTLVRLVA